ncbi:MAG: PAS domain S-box protein [Nitrospirota bacterium]
METDSPIRIIIIEDVPTDAELAERELQRESIRFASVRVETEKGFRKALEEFRPDLIISDYTLPEFDGIQALKLAREYNPTIPFIMFTGSINEETAVACMKAGATDYILKDRIARLPFAVREALEQRRIRSAKKAAEDALWASEERYRRLVENIGKEYFFYRHDTGGIITYVSPSATDMLGYSREEILTHYTDYLTDNPVNKKAIEHTNRSMSGQRQPPYEIEIYHKDGNVRLIELTEVPVFDDSGRVIAVEGVAHDITERKKAEAEIQKRVKDLEDFYEMSVGRELRMIELKEQIKELKEELSKYRNLDEDEGESIADFHKLV